MVILPLYDVNHMFKLSTDVKELCFCANSSFEELWLGPESHKHRDSLIIRFIGIMSKYVFYKCLNNNSVEEQLVITRIVENISRL